MERARTSLEDYRFDGWRKALVLGAPLLLLVVTLLHPVGEPLLRSSGVFGLLQDRNGPWLGVHVVLPFAAGLVAAALYTLVRPLPGRAAAVSRAALGVFVVAYAMFDAVVGLGTGVLVALAGRAPAAERELLAANIDAYFGARFGVPVGPVIAVGAVAWAVAAITAAIALRRAGAPRSSTVPLIAAGLVLAVDHAPPFGPVAMALLFWSMLALVRAASRPAKGARRPVVAAAGAAAALSQPAPGA